MPVSDPDISRSRLIRDASFPEADRREIALRRGRHNANREIGRALKTEFVLQYMPEPQLRAQVRRGLLKVEQLHAMARGAVYYRQRGRINAREVYDQVNACSCLTLILAGIVYWQAREIARIGAAPGFPFDPNPLRHVSPIEWKNVILFGEIKIDPAKAQATRALACISARIWSVPLGLTVTRAAAGLGVTRQALSELLNGRTGISVEMAIRLSKAFGSTPETWLGMQMAYDLWQARDRAGEIAVERFVAA